MLIFLKKFSAATGSIYKNYLYLFGGREDDGRTSQLHKINLINYQWELIIPSNDYRPNHISGCISCCFEDSFYIFGGVDNDSKSYNTIHRFNINLNVWELINVKGELPPPRQIFNIRSFKKKLIFKIGYATLL